MGRGLRWSLFSSALARAGTLLSGIILARLLVPADYGLYTVAFVTLVLLANVNDVGLESTLVRWPGDVAAVARTAATLIFSVSVALFGAAYAAAPFLARSLKLTGRHRDRPAAGVLRGDQRGVRRAVCPADPYLRPGQADGGRRRRLRGVHGAHHRAGGRRRRRLEPGVGPAGRQPGQRGPPLRPGAGPLPPRVHRAIARRLVAAGLPLAGALLCATAVYNVDYLVIGRILGPAALGLYVMAFNLSSWPVSMFTEAVGRVSVAGFARLQTDLPALRPRSGGR